LALTLWILPVAFAIIGIVAVLVALRTRHRRNNRMQLRLLAGRRRLLGEEMETRSQRLADLDPELLANQRRLAEATIDELHMALLDREAHLQILQDLAGLQQHKIAVLEHRCRYLSSSISPPSGLSAALQPTEPQSTEPQYRGSHPAQFQPEQNPGVIDGRENLEDQFLDSIQKRDDSPRPKPKRRR
jgi:hypothetical protein